MLAYRVGMWVWVCVLGNWCKIRLLYLHTGTVQRLECRCGCCEIGGGLGDARSTDQAFLPLILPDHSTTLGSTRTFTCTHALGIFTLMVVKNMDFFMTPTVCICY